MYSAGLSPCPRHSPRGLDPPSSVTPTARTTAIIFQLVLLRGGVWVGGEGAVGSGGWSLAWVLELSAMASTRGPLKEPAP